MAITTAPAFFILFLQGGQSGGGGLVGFFLPMILIFGIFYFLVIRPQQKRQRQAQQEREQLLGSLKPGDKVYTTGGIYGTIVAVRDETVTLRIADKVSIEMLKSAIGGLQSAEVKEAEAVK